MDIKNLLVAEHKAQACWHHQAQQNEEDTVHCYLKVQMKLSSEAQKEHEGKLLTAIFNVIEVGLGKNTKCGSNNFNSY